MRKILLSAALFIMAVGVFAQNFRVENTENLRISTQAIQETMVMTNAVEFEMSAATRTLEAVNETRASRQADVLSEIQQPKNPVLRNVQTRSANVVFSDGFENTTGTWPNLVLADWTITTGTANTTDVWLAAPSLNIGTQQNPFIVSPNSGNRQAIIFSNWGEDNDDQPLDAWLISSEFALEAGKTYVVSFYVRMPGFAQFGEFDFLKVHIGQGNTIAAMTSGTEIYRNETQRIATWTRITIEYTATITGAHNIGFHAYNLAAEGNFIALDDIVIEVAKELPDNALEVITTVFPYTQIPIGQLITPSAQVRNVGTATQTNVVLSAELNGVNIGTSAPVASLAAGVTSANLNTPAVTPVLGNNTLTYTVSSDEGATDNASVTFTGTEHVFAFDNGNLTHSLGHTAAISLGNIYTIYTETVLNKVEVRFNGGTASAVPQLNYSVSVFAMNAQGLPIAPALGTASGVRPAGGGWNTVIFDTPITLQPGNYFIAVNQLTGTNIQLLTDATSDRQVARLILGASWMVVNTAFSGTFGPMVIRLHVDIPQNDLEIVAQSPFDFPQIPASQLAAGNFNFPTPLVAQARNLGLAAQTDVSFEAVFDGVSLGTSNVIASVAPNATSANMTITPSAVDMPTEAGTFNLVYTLSQNEIDENPENNTVTFPLVIGNVYARDAVTVFAGGVGANGSTISAGNIFPIYAETMLTHVQVGFGSNIELNFSVSLFRMTGATTIDAEYLFTVPATRTTSGFMTIEVPPTLLEPGDYFLAVNQTGTVNMMLAFDAPTRTATRLMTKTLTGTTLTTQTGFGAGAIRMVLADVEEPLKVVTKSHIYGSEDVELDAVFTITFNRDITAGDCDLESITIVPVNDNARNGLVITASIEGAVLTITPSGLAAETEYLKTIPADAIVGLTEAITVRFTTIEDSTTILPAVGLHNIHIHPNPVGNEMYIQTEQSIIKVVVLDMQGRVVLQQQGGSRTVNMQSVASGIYTVQVHTEAGIATLRILKQ